MKSTDDGTIIEVRAKPRAKSSGVLRVKDRVVEVALAAPPVEGAANEELVRVLADFFRLGRRAVHLVSGVRGRNKRVLLVGLSLREVDDRLGRIG